MAELRPLRIDAELACEFNGKLVRLRSEQGDKLTCEFPDVKTLLASRRIASNAISLRKLGRRLSQIEQTVDVLVGGRLVARFGKDARSRLLPLVRWRSTELRFLRFFKLVFSV